MNHHLLRVLSIASGFLAVAATAFGAEPSHLDERSDYVAPQATVAPIVDGDPSDPAWKSATWRNINYRWLGPEYSPDDFSGRFKVVWTAHRLYLLVEITDDILIDTHRNPLEQYWDDDCLEVFVDEDYSGGEHHFTHNAFAYHFSLDNRAVDIGTDGTARDYSHHASSRWKQYDGQLIWEVSLDIYADDYKDDAEDNQPVMLSPGKRMGLMVAYCDNDGSEFRENFIGSESVPLGAKDRGYIDAGLFGAVTLGGES